MNDNAAAFYAARDQRTAQLGASYDALCRPVSLVIGADAAASRPGQAAALATVNMLARVHRQLHIAVPSIARIAAGLIPADDLAGSIRETALAINPHITVTLSDAMDEIQDAVTAGIGSEVPAGLDVYGGWTGGRGEIGDRPFPLTGDEPGLIGAATATNLLAAAIFRASHQAPVRSIRLNIMEGRTGESAGTTSVAGPIDVGRVLVAGAGAVAQALLYWARETGVTGTWTIMDGDLCKLHNTNRCLGMTAADAGWPGGTPGGTEAPKAKVAAALTAAVPYPGWYDEWAETEASRPDLILPLANERSVRALIAGRGEPVLLHATTSPNWSAQLHRHIPELDDCPACRFPDDAEPVVSCSAGPARPEKPTSGDAALPFVSSMAGLLLATALLSLNSAHPLLDEMDNHWQIDLAMPASPWMASRHLPVNCPHKLGAPTRTRVYQLQPRRWDRHAWPQPTGH